MDAPVAPTSLVKVENLSSQTVITVSWTAIPNGISPGGDILGYKLYVTNPNTSEHWLAFDGFSLGLEDQTQFTVYNLQSGTDYHFSVLGVNFNGEGSLLSDVKLWAC